MTLDLYDENIIQTLYCRLRSQSVNTGTLLHAQIWVRYCTQFNRCMGSSKFFFHTPLHLISSPDA